MANLKVEITALLLERALSTGHPRLLAKIIDGDAINGFDGIHIEGIKAGDRILRLAPLEEPWNE